MRAICRLRRSARASSRDEVHEHRAAVGQARQRIGQRVFLRLLEHDRVVDDGPGLFRDALEQAPVIVRVPVGLEMIERQAADEGRVVDVERADERGLQARLGQAEQLERHARVGVDQRAAVLRDPAREAFAELDRGVEELRGVGARGEAALERIGAVHEEQRAARPRNDVDQLRRDERHRVGDTEAGAHRLRDLVERVDFAVRERDVLERVVGRRRQGEAFGRGRDGPRAPSRASPPALPSCGIVFGDQRAGAARRRRGRASGRAPAPIRGAGGATALSCGRAL